MSSNCLTHLINRELDIELSSELVELYLEEAIRRGYLEPDEFNNNCYIASSNTVSPFEDQRPPVRLDEQNENIATEKASTDRLDRRKSNKPYELPPSDKLKPTLLSTIEGYIEENRPKRFSIDDVVNYLYPQAIRAD